MNSPFFARGSCINPSEAKNTITTNTNTKTIGMVVYSTIINDYAANRRLTKFMLPDASDLNSVGKKCLVHMEYIACHAT